MGLPAVRISEQPKHLFTFTVYLLLSLGLFKQNLLPLATGMSGVMFGRSSLSTSHTHMYEQFSLTD